MKEDKNYSEYLIYKSNALVGIGLLIILIICNFIAYYKNCFFGFYAISWYTLFWEIHDIYMLKKVQMYVIN